MIVRHALLLEAVPGSAVVLARAESCLLGDFLRFQTDDSLLVNGNPLEMSLGLGNSRGVLRLKEEYIVAPAREQGKSTRVWT